MTQTETTFLATIIGGMIGIAATVIGYWLNRATTLRSIKIIEFNKAAARFQNAFLPQIVFLKHNAKVRGANTENDLSRFLHYYYLDHLKALNIFQAYLSPEDRRSINKAWQEYCCHPEKADAPWFEQYSTKTGELHTTERDLKRIALERIEAILEFAKQK